MVWCRLVVIAALVGCGEDPPPPAEPSAPESEGRSSDAHGPSVPHVVPSPGRVRSVIGTVTVGGVAAREGTEVLAEQPIVVPAEGRAVIQLRDAGRVEIDGPARACVIDEGGAQVLLLHGGLYGVQPPMGNSPRPPLRVVSPGATFEIGNAGEAYLAAFESGASWVSVLGGSAAIENGEADVRRRLRTIELGAGQALAAPGRLAEPTEGPSRLSAAREAAALLALSEGAVTDDADRQARELAHEAERLDQALRWLETETRRGHELTSQHRAAVRADADDEAMRLQRELVEHSRALYRLRRLATSRWERLRVRVLRSAADGHASATDPVAARRDRVVGLLGS